jgi:hypothetical protein
MNKKSIKKLLSYAEGELPKATLGVIKGMIEYYQDGKYNEPFDCLEEIMFAIESYEELQDENLKELNEPCLSDE